MNTPPRLEDLFFAVDHRPLIAWIDSDPVRTPRYRVITGSDGVLGIKPAWLGDATPPLKPLGRHLIADHRLADTLSRELYALTFGGQPTALYWTASPPPGELRPLGAWAAVLYGSPSQDESVSDVLHYVVREERALQRDFAAFAPQVWHGDFAAFAAELTMFRPSLAFTNGFEYDDELTFYVLVTLPFVSGNGGGSGRRQPVLVLDKGRFPAASIAQCYSLRGAALLDALRQELPRLARRFRAVLWGFAKHYYRLQQTDIPRELLMPVALDLFNHNRTPESVRQDDRLRIGIRDRATRAQRFFTREQADLGALVRFLMVEDAFDPRAFDRTVAEYVLMERRAYANLMTRLSPQQLDNQEQLIRYLRKQGEVYNDIERLL